MIDEGKMDQKKSPRYGGSLAKVKIADDGVGASSEIDIATQGKKALKGVQAAIPEQTAIPAEHKIPQEVIARSKRERKPRPESPYKFDGVCRITGVSGKVDEAGYSSKGRARMKSRIRYQQMKHAASAYPKLRSALEKIETAGAIPADEQAVLFDDFSYLTDMLAADKRGADYAAVYHAPEPRKRAMKVPAESSASHDDNGTFA